MQYTCLAPYTLWPGDVICPSYYKLSTQFMASTGLLMTVTPEGYGQSHIPFILFINKWKHLKNGGS